MFDWCADPKSLEGASWLVPAHGGDGVERSWNGVLVPQSTQVFDLGQLS